MTDAFSTWAEQVLLPRPLRGTASAPLPRLEEVRTMLAETVRELEMATRKGLPTILQVSFCVVVTAVEMGVR